MFKARTLILGLFAIAAATGAGLAAKQWLVAQRAVFEAQLQASAPKAEEKKESVEILVSAETLPTGTFLKDKHLQWVPFPEESALESYFIKDNFDPEAFEGAVARASLGKGEPITKAKIVRPGERGFLAAVLKPGMRAVSVPINATTGISGFVFPGDAVDLLLTMKLSVAGEERHVTETVLGNIRVLAVDQRTNDQDGQPTVAKTATLEVEPKQAEVIAVAMNMGRLSLSLRSLATDKEPKVALSTESLENSLSVKPKGTSFVWDTEAASVLNRTKKGGSDTNEDKVVVKIVRRGESQTLSFSGDKK